MQEGGISAAVHPVHRPLQRRYTGGSKPGDSFSERSYEAVASNKAEFRAQRSVPEETGESLHPDEQGREPRCCACRTERLLWSSGLSAYLQLVSSVFQSKAAASQSSISHTVLPH